jgi:N-acyl-L-homoserine lactone synthetase
MSNSSSVNRQRLGTTPLGLTVGELSVRRHHESFALRHQVLCDSLGELPASATGQEQDAWDDRSLHVHASLGGRLVAYVRVILPGPDPLLMESLGYRFDALPDDLRPCVAEPSRMIVDPTLPRGARLQHDLFGKVLAEAHRLCSVRGISAWAFDIDEVIERSLRQRGWPIVRLGDAIEHHGARRTAFFVKLNELHAAHFVRRARRDAAHRSARAL